MTDPEELNRLQTERHQLAGLLENAIDAVDAHAPRGWPEPPMPGDVPPAFIHWQAERVSQLEQAARAVLDAYAAGADLNELYDVIQTELAPLVEHEEAE